MAKWFTRFSTATAALAGHYAMFTVAVMLIIGWALSGPFFGFSDTWQLVINTATTIVTFLMVFLIQNTQNRDSRALHIKLDEIIRALERTDNRIIAAEEDTDEELDELQRKYETLRHLSEP
jgi:low affinity Fe/Cu permease